MPSNSLLKLVLLVGLLLTLGGIGIAHMVKPDRFTRRYRLRRGGEMLTEWNRTQLQIVGAILVALAGRGIYSLLTDYLSQ